MHAHANQMTTKLVQQQMHVTSTATSWCNRHDGQIAVPLESTVRLGFFSFLMKTLYVLACRKPNPARERAAPLDLAIASLRHAWTVVRHARLVGQAMPPQQSIVAVRHRTPECTCIYPSHPHPPKKKTTKNTILDLC